MIDTYNSHHPIFLSFTTSNIVNIFIKVYLVSGNSLIKNKELKLNCLKKIGNQSLSYVRLST